ncbi:MAG: class I SAM-dependent methyltransferase [Pyrinomonadaceae bacterium]
MKIIIGAGNTSQVGWRSYTEAQLDVTDARQWAALFAPASLDAILAEHVWEHLTLPEAMNATRNCFRHLRPGGHLRIAVPDGFHPDRQYRAWVEPVTGYNGTDHKVFYSYRMLGNLLRSAGFHIRLLEWCDERGAFHRRAADAADGDVWRRYGTAWSMLLSVVVGAPYVSLIADGVRPRG